MHALKWANIIFTTSNLFPLRSGGDREFDVVTWWSVFLTLRLTVSFLCCLFLCVSLSPFVEWWTVKCWCWFCDFIFPINLLRHLPIWSIDFSLSIKLGNLIFLSNCRGHQLVPQGKYVHLSNGYNNHAGVSVQFLCTHVHKHTQSQLCQICCLKGQSKRTMAMFYTTA